MMSFVGLPTVEPPPEKPAAPSADLDFLKAGAELGMRAAVEIERTGIFRDAALETARAAAATIVANFPPREFQLFMRGFEEGISIKTESGVEKRVFHRWPEDKLGEPIKPQPVEWGHKATVVPMSRQQRRYWEREQRKTRRAQ